MKKMIVSVFVKRFLGSFKELFIHILKDRFILFGVLLIPILIFIYALTFLVILALVILVIFIVVPISAVSRTKTLGSLSGK
jgi:hypothetical protein